MEIKSEKERLIYLETMARTIRRDIISMVFNAGPEKKGHPGPALSIADIVAALFFEIMDIRPEEPAWADRDRFILSKGHASPVLYAALANRGYFPREQYKSFRSVGGMLQGHPDMKRIPGVDMTTGSLGNGLSAGMGIALAGKMDEKPYKVFVVLGDGECQEGLVWEAALSAPRYNLDNLIAIVDINRFQSCGDVESIMPMDPFEAKWNAFGWNSIVVDGHHMGDIVAALKIAGNHTCGPTVILAKTVKGKGISYMENDNSWHQKVPSSEEYNRAMDELAENGVLEVTG